MLVIVADTHDDGREFSARRDRFTCAEFSHTIAPDGKTGLLMLRPELRTLRVSGSSTDYARVRVFYRLAGALLGTLACSADGRVTWSATV